MESKAHLFRFNKKNSVYNGDLKGVMILKHEKNG